MGQANGALDLLFKRKSSGRIIYWCNDLERILLLGTVLGQVNDSKTAATDLADYSELSALFSDDLMSNHSDLWFLFSPPT